MSIEATVYFFLLSIFFLLSAIVFWWARVFRNWIFYFGLRKKIVRGVLVLCRERLIYGFESVGVVLLVLKLFYIGPDQASYNELVAETLFSNVHATAELYRAVRKDIPYKLPEHFDGSRLKLPDTLVPGDPVKIFDEVDIYIRRASKTLANYFGHSVPECKLNGRSVRIVSSSPDAELVNMELNRIARSKYGADCGGFEISSGMVGELLRRALRETGLEVIGGIFLFFAAVLKLLDLRHKERLKRDSRSMVDWYWDDKLLRP